MSTPDVAYRPTPTDVARLLRARTKDSHGAELGDWSEDTRPTPEEVSDLIEQAIGPVLARIGPLGGEAPTEPVPEVYANLIPAARHLVALGTAMLVEKSYFPEQVASERSAYASYQTEYADCLDALTSGSGDGDGGGGPLPSGGGDHTTMGLPSASVLYAYGGYYCDYWPEPENPANWRLPFQPPREPPLAEDVPVGDEPASELRRR